MKTIHNNLILVSILLFIGLLFQNCVVDHSKTTTLDKAVQSGQKVKIITKNGTDYKFKSVQKKGGQIVGFARKSYSKFKNLPTFQDTIKYKNRLVAVLISEDSIKEIHLINKNLSTLLSITIPVTIIGGVRLIAAPTSLATYNPTSQ